MLLSSHTSSIALARTMVSDVKYVIVALNSTMFSSNFMLILQCTLWNELLSKLHADIILVIKKLSYKT